MNYAGIIPVDLANGPGIRASLFVSGCNFHCPDCFNQDQQDFTYGRPFTERAARLVLDNIAKPYCAGLSILGGDPLWQSFEGMEQLHKLEDEVHLLDKTVWLWSGFTWEALADSVTCFPDTLQDTALAVARLHLVCACDVVVDGPFQKDLKDLSLAWRGSSNQRVIDVQKTIQNGGNVVLWEGTT